MKAKACQISQIAVILLGLLFLCSEVYAELPEAINFIENKSDDVSGTSEPVAIFVFGAGLLSLGKLIRKQQNAARESQPAPDNSTLQPALY